MSAFTPAVKSCCVTVMISNKTVFCLPETYRMTCPRLDTAASRAHTQQFHHWQVLSRQMGITPVLAWSPRRMMSLIAIL